MKKPIVIALLNFLFAGLGYLVIGEKRTFATLALIGSIAGWVWSFTTNIGNEPPIAVAAGTLTIFIAIAFAYDGYMLAKEKQR